MEKLPSRDPVNMPRGGATLAHAFQRSPVSVTPPAPRISTLRKWAAKLLAPLHSPDTATF